MSSSYFFSLLPLSPVLPSPSFVKDFFLFPTLSLSLSTCLLVHFTYSFSLSVFISLFFPSIYLYAFVYLSTYHYLPLCQSVYLHIFLSTYLFACQSSCLSICLSVYQSFPPFSSSRVNETSRRSCHQLLKTIASVIVIQLCNAALQISICR